MSTPDPAAYVTLIDCLPPGNGCCTACTCRCQNPNHSPNPNQKRDLMSAEFYPDYPQTIGQHIKKFLMDVKLAGQLEAGYADQASINESYERLIQVEQAEAEALWAQMEADGAPVPAPETEPEVDAAPEPEADVAPEPEPADPEPEPEAEP